MNFAAFDHFVERGEFAEAISMIGDAMIIEDLQELSRHIRNCGHLCNPDEKKILIGALLEQWFVAGHCIQRRFHWGTREQQQNPLQILRRFADWISELALELTFDAYWSRSHRPSVHAFQLQKLYWLVFNGALPMFQHQPDRLSSEGKDWKAAEKRIAGIFGSVLMHLYEQEEVDADFLQRCGLNGSLIAELKDHGVSDENIDLILRRLLRV